MPSFLNGRRVKVLLPPAYSSQSDHYPVLYSGDAQELFGERESWHADRSIPALIRAGDIPPIIVVAIESLEGDARLEEYAPWNGIIGSRLIQGAGREFLISVRDSLKPVIDQRYRTIPGKNGTYLMGASIAGLLAIYAAYEFDDVYSRIAAFSPTLGWGGLRVLSFADSAGPPSVLKIYQDMGTVEDNSVVLLGAMRDVFIDQGFILDTTLVSRVAKGHSHSASCWGLRLPEMLRFMTDTADSAASGFGNQETKSISRTTGLRVDMDQSPLPIPTGQT